MTHRPSTYASDRRKSDRMTETERRALDEHVAKAIAEGKLTVCKPGEAYSVNESETVKALQRLAAGKRNFSSTPLTPRLKRNGSRRRLP